MSLQTIAVTLGVSVAALAAVAYWIFNQQRYTTNNHNATGESFRVIGNERCGVCLEGENSDRTYLNCGHWIHGECLRELRNHIGLLGTARCPFCRTPIY